MKKFTYILLLSVILFSCKKDFLEIVPKGSLIAEKLADYKLLMNSIRFYEYTNGLPTLVLGDDVAAEEAIFQNESAAAQKAFNWEDVLYESTASAPEFTNYVANLYTCNKVIAEVMAATEGTESEKKSLQAEALALRAWINFQLINLYAKPYAANTATTDPGFPIITKADITVASYSRGTVQQMYDQIVADLLASIDDLPVQNFSRTRMSKPAAKAILGKVYVFMGRYEDALLQFNSAFTDLNASSTPAVLYNYNETFAPGGSFLPIGFFGPNYPGNNINDFTECLLAVSHNGGGYNGNGFSNGGLVLDEEAAQLYGPSDLRLNFYSGTYDDGTVIPGGRIRKYAVQYVKVGMQLPDLYLLRAEVKARLNDLAGAKADVEWLRQNRMPPADAVIPPSIAGSQTELVKFIIDERTREFAGEGYRWFDMRRLSLDPIYAGTTHTHTLYTISGGSMSYSLRPERLVLQFPESVIIANPGMNNNP